MCYRYMNRQIFLNLCLFVVCCIPMFFMQNLFSFLDFAKPSMQEDGSLLVQVDENGKTSIDYATQYCVTLLPVLPLYFISRSFSTFSAACKAPSFILMGTLGSTIAHFISVMILYVWLDLGFSAICYSTVIMYIARFSVNFCLVKFSGRFPKPP
jgi:Na+-driven multidrug efflux pump